jgi:hypothetical protein
MIKKLSDNIKRKFVDVISTDEFEVLTDTGWEDVTEVSKTVPYQIFRIILENGYELECADNHIIFLENGEEIFAKDLVEGIRIRTDRGPSEVKSLKVYDEKVNMYDIGVDSPNHRFYSNGILSHNSLTVSVKLLHYILFNHDKKAIIIANKLKIAKEIFQKIRIAYEMLPYWMQTGVVEWAATSCKLENGSIVSAEATTSEGIRGIAGNCVIGETNVTIRDMETGEVFDISMEELSILMKNNARMNIVLKDD